MTIEVRVASAADADNGTHPRYRLINEHVSDLGGHDNTSAAERSIIRRASVLTTELERMEAKFALAGQADPAHLDLYIRGSGNLRRLLEATGIARRPRNVTPTLQEYLAGQTGRCD